MIHIYTAKLAKKNTAIVRYRAKQTQLWHLHGQSSCTVHNASKPISLNPSPTISQPATKFPNRPCLQPTAPAKLKKLKSFGSAIAGCTYIDVYTGHVDGILVNSMHSLLWKSRTVQALLQGQKAQGRSLLRRSSRGDQPISFPCPSPFLKSVVKPVIITTVLYTLKILFVKSRIYKDLRFILLTQLELPEL